MDELRIVESSIDPSLPTRDTQSWSEFLIWVNHRLSQKDDKSKESVQLITKLGIESVQTKDVMRQRDYSLVAKVAFAKGDMIFKINRDCMLTTESALEQDDLGNFIRNDTIASAMQNIALVLHVLNEHTKKESSPWYQYLNIMPDKVLPVLIMSKEDWKQMLPSAHIYDALKMLRSIARQYSYFYKRLQSTNLPLRRTLTFRYYSWGVSIVCSRQNEIPCTDRQWSPGPVINALIPILDMCNHDHDSNQPIFEDNHSILFAPKPIGEGDEIKINYGNRTSGEFFIHNGFVPDFVRNDMIPINLSLNQQDSLYAKRNRLLKTLNMPSFGRFKLVENTNKMRNRRDPHLTMFLIVYLLPEDDLDMILDSDNPVGLADDLYEHVQYANHDNSLQENLTQTETKASNPDAAKLLEIGRRVSELIEQYSSKRASIGVALINRSLESKQLNTDLMKLLENEKNIYSSYQTSTNKSFKS